jgi:hypothetical protein
LGGEGGGLIDFIHSDDPTRPSPLEGEGAPKGRERGHVGISSALSKRLKQMDSMQTLHGSTFFNEIFRLRLNE